MKQNHEIVFLQDEPEISMKYHEIQIKSEREKDLHVISSYVARHVFKCRNVTA